MATLIQRLTTAFQTVGASVKALNIAVLTENPMSGAVQRKLNNKILDFPFTPLDFMPKALREAVVAGTNTADTSYAYEACIKAALAYYGAGQNMAVRIHEPPGAYVWDRKVKIDLSKTGKTNGLIIQRSGRFASKHYMGPNNKYPFFHLSEYDALNNSPDIKTTTFTHGDTFLVNNANPNYNFKGIASLNVGDRIYVRADGSFQKILATARYRGYLDLSLGVAVTTFGQAAIDVDACQYGDTWIVEKAGTWFGTYYFRGEEIFFLGRNNFRRKNVLNGATAYSNGERDFVTQGFPPTPAAGNYWISSTPLGGSGAPLAAVENMKPECMAIRAGDKVCWTGEAWELIYASPTPRGGILAGGLLTAKRYRGATGGYEHNSWPLAAGKGGYGDWAYLMYNEAGSIAGVAGPHLDDEVFFFGPNGWEKVLRDPNYDVGMLHFTWDFLDHFINIEGGHTDICTQRATDTGEGAENRFNNGILYRFKGKHSAVSNGGLFSDENVQFKDANLSHDSNNAGEAQGSYGLLEKWVYIENTYLPRIEHVQGRMPYAMKREILQEKYPRIGVAGFHIHNGYVPRFLDAGLNARFRIGFWVSSDIWDIVDGSSWEGGEYTGGWAELVEGLRLDHGYRKDGAFVEPTFMVRCRDSKSLKHGIVINGHGNVIIEGSVPITEESYKADGSGLSVWHKPACILIERADNVLIYGAIPTGGFDNSGPPAAPADQNHAWKSTVIMLRGPVGTVQCSDAIFAMNAGSAIDATLAERRSPALQFPGYNPPGEPRPVRVNAPSVRITSYNPDGMYNVLVQGQRKFLPVIDPIGIVVLEGVEREGGGAVANSVAPHSRMIRAHSTNSEFDPLFSVERDRTDFASYQSGELGKIRLRGKDTSGIRREAFSVTAQWGGDSSPTSGATIVKFNSIKAGAPFTFLLYDGLNSIMQVQDTVQLNKVVNAADDAAAASAGVPLSAVYRTGSVLKIRVS